MGEFEAYCHLCGGPLYNPHMASNEAGKSSEITIEEATTGERRLRLQEALWLNSARVLGFLDAEIAALNKPRCFWHETGKKHAFITPLGTGGVSSDVEVSGLEYAIMLYSGRIAVHDNCLILLKRALVHVKYLWSMPGKIQLDVAVACMISLSDDVCGMALYTTLDVGGVDEFRGLHGWDGNCTSEAWYLTDFLEVCEGVAEYVACPPRVGAMEGTEVVERETLPALLRKCLRVKPLSMMRKRLSARGVVGDEASGNGSHPRHSRFEDLPPELLVQILCSLPREDILSLRLASRTIAAISLPQQFWKSRFILDAPYLWELHAQMKELELLKPAPDWRRIYYDLIVGNPETPEFRGLRNRKRVWKVVMQVAEESWVGEMCERDDVGSYIGNAVTYHCRPEAPVWGGEVGNVG